MKGRGVDARGRSKGDRFVRLPIWMLKSEAWTTMSPSAFKLLIHLWSRHNGQNNGEIAYAVRDAEEIGLKKSAASDAFRELVERGFLKIRRASTFTLKTKEARTWELTAEPSGGRAPTNEFMRWSEPVPNRDSRGAAKNKTQSAVPDPQSAVPDRDLENLRIERLSVRHTGPSGAESTSPQSAVPDTSIIPRRAAAGAAGSDRRRQR